MCALGASGRRGRTHRGLDCPDPPRPPGWRCCIPLLPRAGRGARHDAARAGAAGAADAGHRGRAVPRAAERPGPRHARDALVDRPVRRVVNGGSGVVPAEQDASGGRWSASRTRRASPTCAARRADGRGPAAIAPTARHVGEGGDAADRRPRHHPRGHPTPWSSASAHSERRSMAWGPDPVNR